MILFFHTPPHVFYAIDIEQAPSAADIEKLLWLLGNNTKFVDNKAIEGVFVGTRQETITPWSTNAVEITQNMGIKGIRRIEEFHLQTGAPVFDRMLQSVYQGLNQDIFTIHRQPEPITPITDIAAYNQAEGLALSDEEISYLEQLSRELGRPLTDSEVFGFSQVNSEHCRHKIFNGVFVIDGKEMPQSLFQLIKATTKANHNEVVSAYSDNVAFIAGSTVEQFAPVTQYQPDFFQITDFESIISLKAETHNFPTTVEPFNGAATGAGGEIRDRMAGGTGSIPLAGTAVYMTAYSRLEDGKTWEKHTPVRAWLYQTPRQILIKASNGASDFGNKFGQPLICGSLFTFEHAEQGKTWGYDKVIMLAGGIGLGKKSHSHKREVHKGDKIVVLGGDNYRIGMGGGAVSSVATGQYSSALELNAVQRSNPEMQKRAYNVVRALTEMSDNPVVSIHDHGAGGHLNCLSELVAETGGVIDMTKLPIGDTTLSAKEIIGNESQERMGLAVKERDLELIAQLSARERAPMYVVGEATGDGQFTFVDAKKQKPIDLQLAHLFGKPPRTVLTDKTPNFVFDDLSYDVSELKNYIEQVLQLEAVACKDWLTNKVDRSVTGRVAKQQTCGTVQLPLNNVAVMASDYQGKRGVATSIGHAPAVALINSEAGSVQAVAEALTNMVWAHLEKGFKGISLSANWMWAARNEGENARLYQAVEGMSRFAIELGINIPTGKDSLSMVQKYPDGKRVVAPGTVIISTVGEVSDVSLTVSPDLKNDLDSVLLYVDFSLSPMHLGGSSLAQVLGKVGTQTPSVADAAYFKRTFETIQQLIGQRKILAGHDVSSGGLITTLLEMAFPQNENGIHLDVSVFNEKDKIKVLFSEKSAVVLQVKNDGEVQKVLENNGIKFLKIANVLPRRNMVITGVHQFAKSLVGQAFENPTHCTTPSADETVVLDINHLRDVWFRTSYLLDRDQSGETHAQKRYENYSRQPLQYQFPAHFTGNLSQYGIDAHRRQSTGIRAAIIREKGVNGDREMAWAMYLAGFDVKDVHVTDLIAGRSDLSDVNFVVYVGGFSNSDVMGSAKGWAGALLYNDKARAAIENFYRRTDTLSLGVCNGCQLAVELNLLYPNHAQPPRMLHNASGKFESAFINVDIPQNNSIMLHTLGGTRLGIWLAHGEGRFSLPAAETSYNIVGKYSYDQYPGNPNGSDYHAAALCSPDGRHLVMMPHLERSLYAWNWANYPTNRPNDHVSPWIEPFVNARKWIADKK